MKNILTIDGKPISDFGIFISGTGVYRAPEKDITVVSVPGRNGDLTFDNGRFHNIEITYPCYIVREFANRFTAFKNFLLSRKGYFVIDDSYEPECYRKGYFKGPIDPQLQILHKVGNFEITFNCDPRKFLKAGDNAVVFTANGSIFNPTFYPSKPLIRAYGTGSLTVNDVTLTVSSANEYTDIDCDLMDCYKGSTNCNNNVVLSKFPVLSEGSNDIAFTGFTRIEITPRWYAL